MSRLAQLHEGEIYAAGMFTGHCVLQRRPAWAFSAHIPAQQVNPDCASISRTNAANAKSLSETRIQQFLGRIHLSLVSPGQSNALVRNVSPNNVSWTWVVISWKPVLAVLFHAPFSTSMHNSQPFRADSRRFSKLPSCWVSGLITVERSEADWDHWQHKSSKSIDLQTSQSMMIRRWRRNEIQLLKSQTRRCCYLQYAVLHAPASIKKTVEAYHRTWCDGAWSMQAMA